MNTKATTKAEAIAHLSLACMRLQCREDFPRGRIGYLEHICSPRATKAVREDAYKMAVRGLEDTEEARTIRVDIDAYYAIDEAAEAAAALGRKGGASTSAAKRAASRANGAKGGRPIKPAGDSHVWTFAEVAAAFGDRSFVAPAGRWLFVRARCYSDDPESSTWEAFFDVIPSWSDHVGPHDDCDRSVDDLVRKISAKFPSPKGWTYRPDNGTIDQVATFSMPGWAPVAGI